MDFRYLRRAYARLKGEGLEILGIAFVEGDTDGKRWLRTFLDDHELGWPTVAAGESWDGPIPAAYDVHATPFNFLLGRDGRVLGLDVRGEKLEAAIEAALRTPPPGGAARPGALPR